MIYLNKDSDGFTLLEMLFSMSLGMILLTGVVTLLLIHLDIYQRNQKMAAELAAVRISMLFLLKQLDYAGNKACLPYGSRQWQQHQHDLPYFSLTADRANCVYHVGALENTDVFFINGCRYFNNKIRYLTTAYYVAKTSRYNAKHKYIEALFEKNLSAPRIEIEPQITQLHYDVKLHVLRLQISHKDDWYLYV